MKKNFDKNFYNKFTHYLSDILSKISLQDISKDILSIFYSYNSITNKILPSIENISDLDYEILLYSHKFAFICSMSKENSIYLQILSSNIMHNISNKYKMRTK